jgi:hypothetical protein
VALDLDLTPELRRAGLARDAIRLIQEARKASGLDVADRIELRSAPHEQPRRPRPAARPPPEGHSGSPAPRNAKGWARGGNPGPSLSVCRRLRVAHAYARQLSSSSIRKPRIGDGACCIGCGACGRTGAIGWVIAGDICC